MIKLPIDLGWVAFAAGLYAFWYFYYWCLKGKQPMACIAIYPPPCECEIAPGLPFYLPPPPFLPPPKQLGIPCGCNQIQPPVCQALPMCLSGFVNNPLTCGCTPECEVVWKGSSIICPSGSHFNWCVKGCVPDMSMMPDCPAPRCAA